MLTPTAAVKDLDAELRADGAQPVKAHLHELTSTRFFAAMVVFLGHFQDYLALPQWIRWIAGGYGVSFFFVLSGFILTYVYSEHFESGVTSKAYRRYAVARFARIYPSYALALILISIEYLAANQWWRPGMVGFPPDAIASWLANLLALQTFSPSYMTQQMWNAPAWSISTEFAFYVTCPVILAWVAAHCRSRARLLLLFGLVVAYGAAAQGAALLLVFKFGWAQLMVLDVLASRNILWRIPEFLTGVVAARLLYGGHLPWLHSGAFRNGLLVACLALVAVLNAAPWPADARDMIVMRQFRLDLAYMIPFAGIILALAGGRTVVSPVLRRPTWVFLGDISYGIYIYHWIPWTILAQAQAGGWSFPPLFAWGVVLATIAFSAASFMWYERPLRLWLRGALGRFGSPAGAQGLMK
jgi:peptidoglycan/LPS O-acetylase OafA/YrhL